LAQAVTDWRCFVGAFLAPDSARELAASMRLPAGARRLAPETYHVTLKFLGLQPPERAGELLDAVAGLDAGPLTVTIQGVVGLPAPARARVLAATLAPEPRLAAWAERLELRFGREGRPFLPHVTVARCRVPVRFTSQTLAEPLVARLEAPALYRSHLDRSGARYQQVRSTPDQQSG